MNGRQRKAAQINTTVEATIKIARAMHRRAGWRRPKKVKSDPILKSFWYKYFQSKDMQAKSRRVRAK